MFSELLKLAAARMPRSWQRELRRLKLSRAIATGRFCSPEPEYQLLPKLVREGDWVLDIGANVGHYTASLSKLVGPKGRVIAFEPVPETFALLAWNLQILGCQNVTLVNIAASNSFSLVPMVMPNFESGIPNYYRARISGDSAVPANLSLALPIDHMQIDRRVSLVKIDVEGHEAAVLDGIQTLLTRDLPVLILETDSSVVQSSVEAMGYEMTRLAGSPNLLCWPAGQVRLFPAEGIAELRK